MELLKKGTFNSKVSQLKTLYKLKEERKAWQLQLE